MGQVWGENVVSDPFTPILRPLQYNIFSVGSHCHGVVTSYPPSIFIAFVSSMIYLCPVPILMNISTFVIIHNLRYVRSLGSRLKKFSAANMLFI